MSELNIKWLGHACFSLESSGHSAVIDPYRQVPGYPELKCQAGEVYASHTQHDDHGYFEAVKITDQPGPSPFTVTTVDTFHDPEGGRLRGSNRITIFDTGRVRTGHFGDLGHDLSADQLDAVKGLDIALIPVGGFFTIDGIQAAELAAACGARIIIPMHYRLGNRGFDVISEPSVFMDALAEGSEKLQADTGSIRIEDRKAYIVTGGEEKVIDLDSQGQTAVLLRFE